MKLEVFNQPLSFSIDVDGKKLSIISDPLQVLDNDGQAKLCDQVLSLVRLTSGREDLGENEVLPYILGRRGRGKVIGLVRGEHERVKGFVSGHIINDGSSPILINGSQIFHISSAHMGGNEGLKTGELILKALLSMYLDQIGYLSCFIQSPRIYRMIWRKFGENLYPNHLMTPDPVLVQVFQIVTEHLAGTRGGVIDRGVFRRKIPGSFYGSPQLSGDQNINSWFYDRLRISPQAGDLLFLIVKNIL